MDTRKKIMMIVAASVVVLGTAAYAAETESAQTPWQGPPRWQRRAERPGSPWAMGSRNQRWEAPARQMRPGQPAGLLERIADRLDLTEAQRDKLQEMKQDFNERWRGMWAPEMRNRQQRGRLDARPGRRMGRGGRRQGAAGPCPWCRFDGNGRGRGLDGPWSGSDPAQQFNRGPGRGQGRGMMSRGLQGRGAIDRGPAAMANDMDQPRRQGRGVMRPGQGRGAVGPGQGRGAFPLERLFERADTNDDGLLSREEVEAFGQRVRPEPDASER